MKTPLPTSPSASRQSKCREDFDTPDSVDALQAGLEDPTCQLIALLGDDAHWGGRLHPFAPTEQAVGGNSRFFHALEHVAAVAGAVWPQDPDSAQTWLDDVAHRLKDEGAEGLAIAWQELPPVPAAVQTVVNRERLDFTYHRNRINYPEFRRLGRPMGSGMVDSACKTLLK